MQLQDFHNMVIDWDMSPEDAVILYLEWGNNDWRNKHQPVRSKNDFSTYFVVDNWGPRPSLRLVRRNSEEAVDLLTMHLPEHLEKSFRAEFGGLKGVFEPTDEIKNWLRQQLEN